MSKLQRNAPSHPFQQRAQLTIARAVYRWRPQYRPFHLLRPYCKLRFPLRFTHCIRRHQRLTRCQRGYQQETWYPSLFGRGLYDILDAMDVHGFEIGERSSTNKTGAVYHIIYAFNEAMETSEIGKISLNKLDWNCSEIGCWRRGANQRPNDPACRVKPMCLT